MEPAFLQRKLGKVFFFSHRRSFQM